MIRSTAIGLLFSLTFAPASWAQQDGKAQAQYEAFLPYERMLIEEDAKQTDETIPQIAVWRKYVKPGKRDQFESLLRHYRRIGISALQNGRMTPLQERTYRSIRVLPLNEVTKEGNHVYLFLADPYVRNGDYRIGTILDLAPSPKAADSLQKLLRETLAQPETRTPNIAIARP